MFWLKVIQLNGGETDISNQKLDLQPKQNFDIHDIVSSGTEIFRLECGSCKHRIVMAELQLFVSQEVQRQTH